MKKKGKKKIEILYYVCLRYTSVGFRVNKYPGIKRLDPARAWLLIISSRNNKPRVYARGVNFYKPSVYFNERGDDDSFVYRASIHREKERPCG